jgi:hypothetical protein
MILYPWVLPGQWGFPFGTSALVPLNSGTATNRVLGPFSLAVSRRMLERRGIRMSAVPAVEPFALSLLRQHQSGKTVEALSVETGIPAERIEMRLKAAAAYLREHPRIDARISNG